MNTDGASPTASSDDDVARLVGLTERKHELWGELGDCEDGELRNRLFDELAGVREELARLKEAMRLELDEPDATSEPVARAPESPKSVGETLRASLLIPPEEVAPAAPPPPPPSPAEDPSDARDLQPVSKEAPNDSAGPQAAEPEGVDPDPIEPPAETTRPIVPEPSPLAAESTPFRSRQEDLVASRSSRQPEVAVSSEPVAEARVPVGLEERRRSAHAAYQDLERVRPEHARRFPIFAILFAIGAVAVVAWLVFLRPSGSTETIETTPAGNIEAGAPVVDQIRAVLLGLGYDSVLVEDRAGTIHVAGVVGSEDDRSATIAASQALAGDMPLDSSGLTVGGENSAEPPASSVSPPEAGAGEQQAVVDSAFVAGPYIEATLDGKDFVLAGAVPSAALASSYLQAAEVAYSPYVRSELMVDEELESVDWLSRGPNAIVMLPMMIDGTLLIADGQVQISGRSPDQAALERLQGALGQVTGLPVVVDDLEVTNLQPPSYVIAADAGVVELGGQVPTEEIRDMLVEGAVAAYGTDNVRDQITVDPNVYPSLWMYSGGPLLQAMATFPDYELRIDGMAFSGFINGGVDFESGSAVFSGNYAQTLDVGVSVLTRDPSLQLVIEGHTDDRGSDESNLALSQRRAEAVRDYFITNGIDASRLTAVGKGESEPVVPNDSETARARNRRIQYILSSSLS